MEGDAHVEDYTDYPADTLTEIYIKIRDRREALKAKFEVEDAALKEQMEVVSAEILVLCKENNADSIKTKAGTIIRRVDTRYWTNDWDSMYNFIKDNDAYPLLERRLHQSNLKQFLDDNPDKLPMGLQANSKYTVSIRRSKPV
jgi:hypothetical protein